MGSPNADGSKSLILRIPVLALLFLTISFWIWVQGPFKARGGIIIPERRLPPDCLFRPWTSPWEEPDGFLVFLRNVVTGQFGCSAVDLKPVWDEILPYLGQTLGLTAITVATWSLIGAALASLTWRRSPNPVTNSFARQGFWFALLAGLIPGILLVWIRLGLPVFTGLTEWNWGLPPRNTLLFPLPILVTGLAIVGIPTNLMLLLTANSGSPPSPSTRVRRLLLPLARTNFSMVLSTVILAEMIMQLWGYGFGLGGRLYFALVWQDLTQLTAIFYVLFAMAIVGNYIIDAIALRLGFTLPTAHSAPQAPASEMVRRTGSTRTVDRMIFPVGVLAAVTGSSVVFSLALVSGRLAADPWGQLLTGLYNTLLSASGPALLTSLLAMTLVAILGKFGRKNSGLLVSLLADSALSVPILPMVLVGFSLAWEDLQRQMLAVAVIFSLVIAKGVHQEWPRDRIPLEANTLVKVGSYLLLFLQMFSLALAGFTLLGFTLDSLGLYLSPSPSLGEMVYDVQRVGVWDWWKYTIPSVTVMATCIGLMLFSQLLGRTLKRAVRQQILATQDPAIPQ